MPSPSPSPTWWSMFPMASSIPGSGTNAMASTSTAIPFDAPEFTFASKQRGLWGQAWQRLLRNRLALAAGCILSVFILMAILTSFSTTIERYSPNAVNYSEINKGPSSAHFFGTDNLGRDNWSRAWEGMRISLKIGFGTQIVVLIIGIGVGAGAALERQPSDAIHGPHVRFPRPARDHHAAGRPHRPLLAHHRWGRSADTGPERHLAADDRRHCLR